MSLSFATAEGSLPLAYRLYLPHEWTDEPARCERAGVPQSIRFATKHEIAWTQIEAALGAGIPHGTVLMDTGYENATLRDRLTEHQLQYAAGIHPQTKLWWGEHQPGPMPPKPSAARVVSARCAMRGISQSVHCTSHRRCPLRPIAP